MPNVPRSLSQVFCTLPAQLAATVGNLMAPPCLRGSANSAFKPMHVFAAKYVPGAYALVVNDDMPDSLRVSSCLGVQGFRDLVVNIFSPCLLHTMSHTTHPSEPEQPLACNLAGRWVEHV